MRDLLLIAPGFLVAPVPSCAQYPQQDFKKTEIRSSRHWIDIDYVGDGQVGHRLDIHLPEKEPEKYPVIISIYGSAWYSGGHLAALAGTTNHMDTFELNGKTIQIEGELGRFTKISSHVDAVVDWFGPANFLIMDECGSSMSHNDEKSPESSLIGGPIQSNKEKCHFADPATYANAETSPFLIFHGDEDPLVPHCQSEYLHDKLRSSGAESELVLIRGGKHGPGVLIPEHFQKMISFFNQQRSDS